MIWILKAMQRLCWPVIGENQLYQKDIDHIKYICGLKAPGGGTRYNWSSGEVCHLRGPFFTNFFFSMRRVWL